MTSPRLEDQPEPPARRRTIHIPAKLFGHVRTSTAALGVAFILTALLFNHVRPTPVVANNVPAAVVPTTSEYVAPRSTQTRTTTATPTPSSSETSGQGTGDVSTAPTPTTASTPATILPGVVLPPQIASLIPTQAPTPTPQTTTAR